MSYRVTGTKRITLTRQPIPGESVKGLAALALVERPSFESIFARKANQGKRKFSESHRSRLRASGPGRSDMSGQVVLYFEDQADALRFALAAGSVMAGEGGKFTDELLEETSRVARIRLDAVNAGNVKKSNPVRAA